MGTPEEARLAMNRHFSSVTPEQFKANVEKFDAEPGTAQGLELATANSDRFDQLTLGQIDPFDEPLDAYWASALTDLSDSERARVDEVARVVQAVCDDFGINLYEPGMHTDPGKHSSVPAPVVRGLDKQKVKTSDLFICLSDFPSTGAGQELVWAEESLVPIVLVIRAKTRISRMVTGIPGFKVELEYNDCDHLAEELGECLLEMRPILVNRKMAFKDYSQNIVGNRVRELRQRQNLTRADLAPLSRLSEEQLEHLEDSNDNVSDPNLTHLRQVAAALNTTVADLVEPNLQARVVGQLLEWARGSKIAARGMHGASQEDMRKGLVTFLLEAAKRINEQ